MSDNKYRLEAQIYDIGPIRHAYSPYREPATDPFVIRYKKVRKSRVIKSKSPSQDMTSVTRAGQIPKTLGDTNEFISAFWVNGKPKCRQGYRYDFRRKMCRLIK